jgi:hypothetical protein
MSRWAAIRSESCTAAATKVPNRANGGISFQDFFFFFVAMANAPCSGYWCR